MRCEDEINKEIEAKWNKSEPIKGIKYLLNDAIKIIKGKYEGEVGSVISLVELNPEPKYYVELSNGKSIVVLESLSIGL